MRRTISHPLKCAAAALALLAAGTASAHTSVSVGVDLGWIGAPVYGRVVAGDPYWPGPRYWGPPVYRPWVALPPPVIYAPPPVVYAPPVVVAPPPPPRVHGSESVPPRKPDPIIYPRNGQDDRQTEADRQACNRWATTQKSAMEDASVFQRAVEACMDGRGYSMR